MTNVLYSFKFSRCCEIEIDANVKSLYLAGERNSITFSAKLKESIMCVSTEGPGLNYNCKCYYVSANDKAEG